MGQIQVEINRKVHSLLCADGEENRLEAVARYVSAKADELVDRLGQVNDTQLLLMVSMLLADEIRDYRVRWYDFDSESEEDEIRVSNPERHQQNEVASQ